MSEELDESLITYNLSLSYEQRLLNHQNALETINELIKARKQIYIEAKKTMTRPKNKSILIELLAIKKR